MADVTPPNADNKPAKPRGDDRPSYRRLTAALAGGVVGGVIVLALGALIVPELVQRRVDEAVARIALDPSVGQRLAALEQEMGPLASLPEGVAAQGQKLDSLGGELAGLGGRLTETSGRLDDLEPLPKAQAELGARVARLEGVPGQDLTPLEQQVGAATRTADDLRALLGQLDGRVKDLGAAQDGAVRRLDTLSAAVAEAERRLYARAEQIGDRLAVTETAVSGKLESLARTDSALADLQAALAGQTARVSGIDDVAKQAATTAAEAASAVESKLGSAAAAINSRFARAERGNATALALTELDQALGDGRPFPTAQALLESQAPGDAALERATALLRPAAPGGVATLAALEAELAALGAAEPGITPSSTDWVEQTRQNILGLVTVKRLDGNAPAATGPTAPADALTLLRDGELAKAIALVEASPAGALPAGAAWLAKAKARQDAMSAEALLRQRLGELLIRES